MKRNWTNVRYYEFYDNNTGKTRGPTTLELYKFKHAYDWRMNSNNMRKYAKKPFVRRKQLTIAQEITSHKLYVQ